MNKLQDRYNKMGNRCINFPSLQYYCLVILSLSQDNLSTSYHFDKKLQSKIINKTKQNVVNKSVSYIF